MKNLKGIPIKKKGISEKNTLTEKKIDERRSDRNKKAIKDKPNEPPLVIPKKKKEKIENP